MERWQSGRSRILGKDVYEQSYRGFESPSLRILELARDTYNVFVSVILLIHIMRSKTQKNILYVFFSYLTLITLLSVISLSDAMFYTAVNLLEYTTVSFLIGGYPLSLLPIPILVAGIMLFATSYVVVYQKFYIKTAVEKDIIFGAALSVLSIIFLLITFVRISLGY